MNSAVRSIFNEKVAEKWNLWVRKQCTGALFTVEKSTFAATVHEKKKKTKREFTNAHVASAQSKRVLCQDFPFHLISFFHSHEITSPP